MKPHPREERNGAFAAVPIVTVVHSDRMFWLRRSTLARVPRAHATRPMVDPASSNDVAAAYQVKQAPD
jgi:hypothetical protein